ncbi:MAG: (2Fe-2S)-binding protein, partial [Chloroflexi bacterium]|nr:(2Fe-2S)-binding protein [Chloroflexota bacterium]
EQLEKILSTHRVRAGEGTGVIEAVGKKRFVCLCEDVTSKDLVQGVAEGFADIQSLKRYSTATMGPCQGKMCHRSVARITAHATGRTVEEAGATTHRPPFTPVPLGALAGHIETPLKLTPMDRRNRQLGARITDMGPWQRAYIFTDPQEEVKAIRERVGLIDVTTLGKLDVRGKDAPKLLDKIYTNRMSDVQVGRVRYGVMCSESGTIIDDGTVSRLADDHYFVSTTSGSVERIEEWIKWWAAGTGMCVHVNNLTGAYGAINVAGPKARETLSKLTDVDISSDGFKYMRFAQGFVAGVPAIMLRIGFVGETGWELHFPAEYGEHIWDALMDAGKEFGILPCGLESQRILRLEKRHVIVNQDTDAITTPLEADMDWAVKMDKEDFVGRGSLRIIKERGIRNKVVGFVMRNGLVPEDGDPIVSGGFPVGRVTSSRYSASMGKGVGLAWVPIEMANEGQEILIRITDNPTPALVTFKPFYDPEGERLRS